MENVSCEGPHKFYFSLKTGVNKSRIIRAEHVKYMEGMKNEHILVLNWRIILSCILEK
jgi:hypothetical protein